MGLKRYPLDALEQLRQKRVDDAAADLAERERASAAALAARDDARARAVGVRAEHERVRSAEREALGDGALRAADLARAASWQVQASAEVLAAEAAVGSAEEIANVRADERTKAQEALIANRADAKVVERHHDGFREREARARLAAEEISAEETWRRRG